MYRIENELNKDRYNSDLYSIGIIAWNISVRFKYLLTVPSSGIRSKSVEKTANAEKRAFQEEKEAYAST